MDKELFILGLLAMEPMSGSALQRVVQSHGRVYPATLRMNAFTYCRRLQKNGEIVAVAAAAARGPRKTKDIFTITPAGRARLRSMLERTFTTTSPVNPTLELALVLAGGYGAGEALDLLRGRREALVANRKRLVAQFGDYRRRGPFATLAATHAIEALDAELRWARGGIALLRDAARREHRDAG